MSDYTSDEKHQEAIAEVRMRRQVYGRAVRLGSMKRWEMDRKIAIMQAIADDYAPALKLPLGSVSHETSQR